MIRKLVIPAAIVTAFAFTPVLAEQSGDTGGSKAEREQEKMGMEQQDQTETSSVGNTETSFDELDRNQDGKIDEEELNVWGSTAAGEASGDQADPTSREQMLKRYDLDGDGTISRDELEKSPMPGKDTDQ